MLLSLDAQIAFFKDKQVDLAEKHHGKVVLIYAKKVVGASMLWSLEAYGPLPRVNMVQGGS